MKALVNRGENAFRKKERIRQRAAYLLIYQRGIRAHSRYFTVVSHENQVGYGRIGITVSKKVGDAVRRNRTKRLIREFFRLNKSRLTTSRDIVVIGKKGIPYLSYQDIYRELACLLSPEAGE